MPLSPDQQSDVWKRRVEESLRHHREQVAERAAKVAAAADHRYARRKDAYGRWIRTGKRVPAAGREVVSVSLPLVLAEKVHIEAEDVNYPYSRLVAFLVHLGLPVWEKYRADFLLEHEPENIPISVSSILRYRPRSEKKYWHQDVEQQLKDEAERLKKQRAKRADTPTDKALKYFGGNT